MPTRAVDRRTINELKPTITDPVDKLARVSRQSRQLQPSSQSHSALSSSASPNVDIYDLQVTPKATNLKRPFNIEKQRAQNLVRVVHLDGHGGIETDGSARDTERMPTATQSSKPNVVKLHATRSRTLELSEPLALLKRVRGQKDKPAANEEPLSSLHTEARKRKVSDSAGKGVTEETSAEERPSKVAKLQKAKPTKDTEPLRSSGTRLPERQVSNAAKKSVTTKGKPPGEHIPSKRVKGRRDISSIDEEPSHSQSGETPDLHVSTSARMSVVERRPASEVDGTEEPSNEDESQPPVKSRKVTRKAGDEEQRGRSSQRDQKPARHISESPDLSLSNWGDSAGESSQSTTSRSQSRLSETSQSEQQVDTSAEKDPALRACRGPLTGALKALQSIGVQKREGKVINHEIKIGSTGGQILATLAQRIEDIYRQLLDTDPQEEGAEIKDIDEYLKELESRFEEVDGVQARRKKKGSRTVIDMYANLIPNIVRMLDAAVRFHGREDDGEIAGLEQIIAILDLTLLIYANIKVWESKPPAYLHVVLPISQNVMPAIKGMRKSLRSALAKRKLAVKQKETDKENEAARQQDEAEDERRQIERRREIKERHMLINQQLARNLQLLDGPRHPQGPSPPSAEREEARELRGGNQEKEDNVEVGGRPEEAFERVRMFVRPNKTGPEPAEWTQSEVVALVQGLERFEGMFDPVFSPGGLTVIQLLTLFSSVQDLTDTHRSFKQTVGQARHLDPELSTKSCSRLKRSDRITWQTSKCIPTNIVHQSGYLACDGYTYSTCLVTYRYGIKACPAM